jgi:nucleoside-diphosphate-sugar epimerase
VDVLVTGAAGFVGGAVARHLAAGGHRVFGLCRRGAQSAALAGMGITPVLGDLVNPDPATFPPVDAVVHAAAILNDARPDLYRRVNVDGTRMLAEWASIQGARRPRFVLVSSVGVYGHPAALPADEATPCRPTNIYEETKLAGEEAVRALAERGLPAVIVRPAWVYGPGDRKNLKLFRMIDRGRFPMIGRGETPLSPVFVDDVAAGIALAATLPGVAGRTFILGPPGPVPLADLCRAAAGALGRPLPRLAIPLPLARVAAVAAEALWRVLPGTPPISRRRLLFYTRPQVFSIDAAWRILGYRPAVGLDEGMRLTVDWYRREGWL